MYNFSFYHLNNLNDRRWPPRTGRTAPSASRRRQPSAACATSHRRGRSLSPPLLAPRAVIAITVDRTIGGRPPPPLVHQAVMVVLALASRAMLPMSHVTRRRCPSLVDVARRSSMSHLWSPLMSHADARCSCLETPSSTFARRRSRLVRYQPLPEIETLIPRVRTAFMDARGLGCLRWCS